MADIDDSGDVFPPVYQLATTDPGVGGPPNDVTGDGALNRPLRHLAQRTAWLKTRVDALIAAGTQMASTAVAGLVQLSDSVTSTATDRAATANAVRIANENANARVLASRTITGSGLATGGGTLEANRTITVPKASPADAVAGTRDDVALTPLGAKAAMDDRFAQIPASVPPSRTITASGLATGGGDLSANRTITVSKATTAQATAGTNDTVAMTPATTRAAIIDHAGHLAGMLADFAMPTAPEGWLVCNGAAVSRTTYARLFAAIGTTWGAGNGTTTFNVPDLRGEFRRGWDNGRGVDAGRAFGSAQSDAVGPHKHQYRAERSGTPDGPGAQSTIQALITAGYETENPTPFSAETRPRNIAVLTCIKT